MYEFQYDEYTILGITNLNVLKWYVQTFKDNLKYFKNLRQTFRCCDIATNYKQFINMHYSYVAGLKLRCKTLLKNRRYCKNTITLFKLNNYNKIKKRYFKGYKKN